MNRRTAILFAAVWLSGAGALAGSALRLSPGETTTIELPENVTTGYSWAIDPDASRNLGILTITDAGHRRAPGRARVGAGGKHIWTVKAVSPGSAVIALNYRRPWEKAAGRQQLFEVDVAP